MDTFWQYLDSIVVKYINYIITRYLSWRILKCEKWIKKLNYLPPSSSPDIYNAHLSSVESLIHQHPSHSIIICGDYNLSGLSCSNDKHGICYSSLNYFQLFCFPEFFKDQPQALIISNIIIQPVYKNEKPVLYAKYKHQV